MLKVGITGGIGSGKSTVCRIFEALQIPIYYADDRAKWIIGNDLEVRTQIISAFGEEAFNESGLNRAFLAKIVFSDPAKTAKINSIVHPAVGKDFANWVDSKKHAKYVMKEAALMFESSSYKTLDKVICVSASTEIRISRTLNRDSHRSRQDILNIMSKQLPEEEKKERSDFTINNNGTELIIPQVMEIHSRLLA